MAHHYGMIEQTLVCIQLNAASMHSTSHYKLVVQQHHRGSRERGLQRRHEWQQQRKPTRGTLVRVDCISRTSCYQAARARKVELVHRALVAHRDVMGSLDD